MSRYKVRRILVPGRGRWWGIFGPDGWRVNEKPTHAEAVRRADELARTRTVTLPAGSRYARAILVWEISKEQLLANVCILSNGTVDVRSLSLAEMPPCKAEELGLALLAAAELAEELTQ